MPSGDLGQALREAIFTETTPPSTPPDHPVVRCSPTADSRAVWVGLVAYATYDLTNLALTRDFPLIVAVVDKVLGMAVSVTVGLGGYGFARWAGV